MEADDLPQKTQKGTRRPCGFSCLFVFLVAQTCVIRNFLDAPTLISRPVSILNDFGSPGSGARYSCRQPFFSCLSSFFTLGTLALL